MTGVVFEFREVGRLSAPTGAAHVRLRIGERELLGWGDDPGDFGSSGPWCELPLVSFACWGMVCLRQTLRAGRYAIELDELGDAILLVRRGSRLIVHATRVERTAELEADELVDAWRAFAVAVRDRVCATFPEAASLRWWEMIDNDPYPASQLDQMSWREWFLGHESHLGSDA